ncbi:MAG TPA: selenocysteine-specific translation elongation factor, partial [Longimicrobiales bacterium]|nr:selenocysteine-specific translation elongation factor [Longimicrobiales bacterium]
MSRRLVLGTAGHIDHGKTALVRALTGIDTDRLPEEKRRGISIDLGFAHLPLEAGLDLAVVDVPGHESLVRNMLAGATGIDIVLLVIAADEGIMPQTREHLAIMELLEVGSAVVALTKVDRVEADWLELVIDDVRRTLAGSRYADAPLVPVSAVTGQGLSGLRAALVGAAATAAGRTRTDLLRLPIDRVFTVRGTGTVVTGTIWSGAVRSDAVLRALPGDLRVRVRGLQRHGSAGTEAGAGERVALAVAVEREQIARGMTLVDGDAWQASLLLTLRVQVLAEAGVPLRARQRVRFHLGTAEVLGRITPLEGPAIEPGASGWAQLRLEKPVVARAGDRFVIRHYSPVRTIAGGAVVETVAPRRKRCGAALDDDLRAILGGGAAGALAAVRLAGAEGLEAARLPIASPGAPPPDGLPGEAVFQAGDRLFAAERATRLRDTLVAAVRRVHERRPLELGIEREELRRAGAPEPAALVDGVLRELLAKGMLLARGSTVAAPDFEPTLDADQEALATRVAASLATAGLAAPRLAELPEPLRSDPDLPGVVRRMVAEGRLVALA